MIHKLTTEQQKEWLQFAKAWHGYRFLHNGRIMQKWEMFSEIMSEKYMETFLYIALERGKGEYLPIPSNYHKTKVIDIKL